VEAAVKMEGAEAKAEAIAETVKAAEPEAQILLARYQSIYLSKHKAYESGYGALAPTV
jgi:hypothetical protein